MLASHLVYNDTPLNRLGQKDNRRTIAILSNLTQTSIVSSCLGTVTDNGKQCSLLHAQLPGVQTEGLLNPERHLKNTSGLAPLYPGTDPH